MKKPDKGIAAVHLAVLLFGTAGLFGKLLELSPVMIVFGRVAFASLFLALFIILQQNSAGDNATDSKSSARLKLRLLIPALGIILTVHWITFFHSIQLSTVAIGLLSFSTFPIFVVFLEPVFLKSSFQFSYLFYALLTLIGVWLLVPRFSWSDTYFQGVFWGCVSGLLFAFLTIINRFLSPYYASGKLAFFQNGIAFLLLIPVAYLQLKAVTFRDWLILLLLGVVFTAVSHTLFIFGLRTVKARIASIIACMEPVYGILFAFLLLNEIPALRTALGGLIILSTTLYLTFRRTTQENIYDG